MRSSARVDALGDVVRDALGLDGGSDYRDRAIGGLAFLVVVVLIVVVTGVAWGLTVFFAALSVALAEVATRPGTRPPTVAVEGVRILAEPPQALGSELVRAYPIGAFGPAEGVVFRLVVVNDGPRSTFRARWRPIGASEPGGGREPDRALAWGDDGASFAEIPRGERREIRVAACYQHGSRRLLRFFAPTSRNVERGALAARTYSVADELELPPTAGSLPFVVTVVDEGHVNTRSAEFVLTWDEMLTTDPDHTRLPTLHTARTS